MSSSFPIVKLASLAVKQVSKPLANRIKNRAKKNPFFKTYICMPPAQLYHWIEVNIKMKMLNLGKARDVPKLNEEMAIDLGAELLGEFIIFTVASLTLVFEYLRQSRKSERELNLIEERFLRSEVKIANLEAILKEANNDLNELSKIIESLNIKLNLVKPADNDKNANII